MNQPERLVLTEGQSEHLRAAGVRFAVVQPGSYPETPGRFILDLIPCAAAVAVDALSVAIGTKRAVNPRSPRLPIHHPERLVLTEGQSEHLRVEGVRFAVVDPGSHQATPARLVLDLIPCDYAVAVDALAVAIGAKRAVKLRSPRRP